MQDKRHLLNALPHLNVLTLTAFDRSFSESGTDETFLKIISAWLMYDALRDYREDLRAGLVLFPKNLLDDYGVELSAGQHISPNFYEFHSMLKKKTILDILTGLKSILHADIPLAARIAFQLYFIKCIVKLLAFRPTVSEKVVFSATLNAAGE